MVSSIAIAVVLAILAILLIGKIAGWNILGGKGKTEESTDVITTEGTNDTTAQETVPMVNVVGLYKTAAEEQMKKNGCFHVVFSCCRQYPYSAKAKTARLLLDLCCFCYIIRFKELQVLYGRNRS